MPAFQVTQQKVDLSRTVLPTLRITDRLADGSLISMLPQISNMDSDFPIYATAKSVRTIAEYFWKGSTECKGGLLLSPMFGIACDSAVYMALTAGQEMVQAARCNSGHVRQTTIWSRTIDQHASFGPEWNALCLVQDPHDMQQPCLVWGFEEEMLELIPDLKAPSDRRLN